MIIWKIFIKFVLKIFSIFFRLSSLFHRKKDEDHEREYSTSLLRPGFREDNQNTIQSAKLCDPPRAELEEILVECPKSPGSKTENVAKVCWPDEEYSRSRRKEEDFIIMSDESLGYCQVCDENVRDHDTSTCPFAVKVCGICGDPCKNEAEHGQEYYILNYCMIHGMGHLSRVCPEIHEDTYI